VSFSFGILLFVYFRGEGIPKWVLRVLASNDPIG
jgi:hypothetical protein